MNRQKIEKAPKGKFRVIGEGRITNEDYVVGDYNTEEEAVKIVAKQNKLGVKFDKYWCFNDKGYKIY